MAKQQKGGSIAISFDSTGALKEVYAYLQVGSTEDVRFSKIYSKKLTLTGAQITAIQNFIDNKFAELKTDEGV